MDANINSIIDNLKEKFKNVINEKSITSEIISELIVIKITVRKYMNRYWHRHKEWKWKGIFKKKHFMHYTRNKEFDRADM